MQDIDVVPSDIIAGLILMQRQQQMRAVRLDFDSSSVHSSAPRRDLTDAGGSPSSQPVPSWMTLENASHFMKFAGASYGWPFFLFSNPFCGPCRLCCSCR